MPTTIYSKEKSGSVGFEGKQYEIKDGAVSVPDHAVGVLVESHGFSYEPFSALNATVEKTENSNDAEFVFDSLTKTQLLELNETLELGANVKLSMSLADLQAVLKPLYEAKIAAEVA